MKAPFSITLTFVLEAIKRLRTSFEPAIKLANSADLMVVLGCPICLRVFPDKAMNVTKLDTSQVETMNSMFQWCAGVWSIGDVSQWDTSQVVDMSCMFIGCYSLSLDCSQWNVANVTEHELFSDGGGGNASCLGLIRKTSVGFLFQAQAN